MAPTKSAPPPNANQQLQDQLNQVKKDLERNRIMGLARDSLMMFEHTVFARAERWTKTARNIGSAYALAAKRHRDAISAEDASRSLQAQMFFSVLTVLSAGSLSWVWEINNLAKMGKILGPVLKDSVLTGMGEVFDNGVAIAPPKPLGDAVTQEPLQFQNDLENRISDFIISAHTFMFEVWKGVRNASPERWDRAYEKSLRAMTDNWLAHAQEIGILDVSKGEEKAVSDMAVEFERGFWKTWIFGLSKGWVGYDGISHREYESIHTGGAIAGRLEALGILREAGVTITRWHEAIEEDRPLIDWASNKYRPRIFQAEI